MEEHVETLLSPKRRRTAGVEGIFLIIYFIVRSYLNSNSKQCALFSIMVPGGIVNQKTNLLNHEKSLMFKYGRTHKKISSWLVCGSRGTCLDCILLGVQVTAGLGFFTVFRSFSL